MISLRPAKSTLTMLPDPYFYLSSGLLALAGSADQF